MKKVRVAPHQITPSPALIGWHHQNHLRPRNSETIVWVGTVASHGDMCTWLLYSPQMQLIPKSDGAHALVIGVVELLAVRFIFAGVTSLESCLDSTPSYLRLTCRCLLVHSIHSVSSACRLSSGGFLGNATLCVLGFMTTFNQSLIWTLIHDLCFWTSVIWIVVSSSQSLLSPQALRKACCSVREREMLTSLINQRSLLFYHVTSTRTMEKAKSIPLMGYYMWILFRCQCQFRKLFILIIHIFLVLIFTEIILVGISELRFSAFRNNNKKKKT